MSETLSGRPWPSTSSMGMPWFRLYSEAVDDAKLRLLAFEDRWHFVAILCCKCSGELNPDPMMRRKVAIKLGLNQRELDEVSRRLAEVGLIDAETLQPLAWDDRQFVSDSSSDRTRAYRERMKQVKRHGDAVVTAQDTDTDEDTDKVKRVSTPRASAPVAADDFRGDSNLETLNGRAVVLIASGFELPDSWGKDAELLGWKSAQILKEAEKFRQYWTVGKGAGKRRNVKGWRQSWSNWMAKAEAR